MMCGTERLLRYLAIVIMVCTSQTEGYVTIQTSAAYWQEQTLSEGQAQNNFENVARITNSDGATIPGKISTMNLRITASHDGNCTVADSSRLGQQLVLESNAGFSLQWFEWQGIIPRGVVIGGWTGAQEEMMVAKSNLRKGSYLPGSDVAEFCMADDEIPFSETEFELLVFSYNLIVLSDSYPYGTCPSSPPPSAEIPPEWSLGGSCKLIFSSLSQARYEAVFDVSAINETEFVISVRFRNMECGSPYFTAFVGTNDTQLPFRECAVIDSVVVSTRGSTCEALCTCVDCDRAYLRLGRYRHLKEAKVRICDVNILPAASVVLPVKRMDAK